MTPDQLNAGRTEYALQAALAAATAARAAGQTTTALEQYAALRDDFPDRVEPFARAAALLIEIGRFDEGEALLSLARDRFPADAAVAIEHAWSAYRRRDVPQTLARWQAVRDAFPDHPLGYTGAVVMLRETGAFDQADALLDTACVRFPDDPSPFIEQAWMAMARKDAAAAMQRWAVVRTRFPAHWLGYTGGALALRDLKRFEEAEALLAIAVERFPDVFSVKSEHAWLAAVRQDWQAALARWNSALLRFPDRPEPRIGQIRALRELRRLDAATQAAEQAMARFADHPETLTEVATLAEQVGEWEAAATLWELLRTRRPDDDAGWRQGALAAAQLGRTQEAAALRAERDRRASESEVALLERADLARRERRWPDLAELGDDLRLRFPHLVEGYAVGAIALGEQNRLEDAASLLDAMEARFPGTPALAMGRAWLAHAAGDQTEAAERFQACRRRDPDSAEAVVGLVRSLAAAGRFDEAAAFLTEGLQRFPADPRLVAAQSLVAPSHRAAWQGAQRQVRSAPAHLPPPRLILVPEPAPAERARDPALRDFVMRFESLGGDRFGAEFGMVQRACGGEVQGLLDRADVPIDGLCAMLEAGFEGIGEKANTELFVLSDSWDCREYGVRDRRGWFTHRAFISPDRLGTEEMLDLACGLLRQRTRALAEALAEGQRCFVYRMTGRKPARTELGRLREAMRHHGKRTMLLHVADADAAHPDGTVRRIGEGLLLGRATALPPVTLGGWLPAMEAWLMTLGNAQALRDGTWSGLAPR